MEFAFLRQFHLIGTSLPRTEAALLAGGEGEQCPLKLKLPYLCRGVLEYVFRVGKSKGPVLIELEDTSGAIQLPDPAQILNRDTWCSLTGSQYDQCNNE